VQVPEHGQIREHSVMNHTTVQLVALLLIAALAVASDIRTRRIPNLLTLGGALAALVYMGATAGLSGLGTAAGGWLTGAALFFPFFALRGMGAGDVKLLAALGAWLGPNDTIWLAIFAAMAGGVFGIVVAIARGYLTTAFRNVWVILTHWRVAGVQPVPGLTLTDSKAPRLAYALPIAAGLVVTLWRH
jgi:prepilin peptidase CpaA